MGFEVKGCSSSSLDDAVGAVELLKHMANLAGLSYISGQHHKFTPQGVTALLLVEESHLSIHTWPELGYAVIDVCSCKAISGSQIQSLEDTAKTNLQCGNVTTGV